VTADIVTVVHQDVVALPNAAVVQQGSSTYVLVPATALTDAEITASANGGTLLTTTNRVPVTTGLANDSVTEITSGVNVGDQVIVQTIKSTSAAAAAARTTSVTSILGGAGARAVGGGGFGGAAAAGR
jgi:hypothetical protein